MSEATITGAATHYNFTPPGENTVNYVHATGAVTVQGGTDDLNFVGGAGETSVVGGSGSNTLFGGSSTNVLLGGPGNNTLVGGTGLAASVMANTQGGNAVIYANGAGPTEVFGGSGLTVFHGTTGTGPQLVSTNPAGNSGALVAQLNGANDTVVGGSGEATIIGGSGKDTYSFLSGHAGGSEVISNFKPGDQLLFGGYGPNPLASEVVTGGSDHITLTDGTKIELLGLDHKVF